MKRTSTFLLHCVFMCQLVACSEQVSKYHLKYEDAANDSAVKRGWIPEIVPKTSTEIHEQHDLDTSDVWLRFNVQSLDKGRLSAGFEKADRRRNLKNQIEEPFKIKLVV